MSTLEQKIYTPEDLLAMPDGKHCELVNGELVERKMGWDSSWISRMVTSSGSWIVP